MKLLVFGGTHPGAWRRTLEVFHEVHPKRIFVTGGHKRSGIPHHTWTQGDRPEAEVIREHLVDGGVPPELIVLEKDSENSRDNVLNIRDQFLRSGYRSLGLVCRSYAVGRQSRTFLRFIESLELSYFTYETEVGPHEGPFGLRNWREQPLWRSHVWGEYLRTVVYGRRGGLVLDFEPLVSLEEHLNTI